MSELSALTRLFSSAVFQEMAKRGRSALFKRLVEQTGIVQSCRADASVGDAFDAAFKVLQIAGQRDEYIYRAAIVKKILIGKHSLHTASMLNEFRAGSCKADLVILNGTSSVYEIKSERDSLSRLENQIENYKNVFATVNVIVSENHVESVRQVVTDDVGIMCLSKRYQISVVRDAHDCPERICPVTVFESLRSAEAEAILKSLGIAVPTVPNTQRYGMLRELFANLQPAILHREFVQTLKQTRNLAPLGGLINQLPASLHAAALSIPVRRADHDRLVGAVTTPLEAAKTWI
ncbi:sce7726 family protein [Azospirillum sp. TSH100]|uniref:sce7726 family protein n=1 Tax=Azospirillum sp. TSH100 TaxID=652764 RepID=UPI001FFF8243|nr:sce7726 family protein [Azospirillum sp. TSH100]